MKSRDSSVFIVSLVASALALTGCTGKRSNDPPKTIYAVSIAKIKGMDPIHAEDLYSGYETSRVYEGLYQYHYLKRPYQLTMNLAEAMPQVSADGKTYTIKL